MKIEEFIFESPKQVISGIEMSQEYAKEKGAKISARNLSFIGAKNGGGIVYMDRSSGELIEKIDLDIAVTAKESDTAIGGVGLFVGAIGLGPQGQVNSENSTVSRVRFSVPLHLPKRINE